MKIENCKLKSAKWTQRLAVVFLLLTAVCVLPSAAAAQGTPGTGRCPAQTDTLDSLFRITDSARTNLSAAATSGATSIAVLSTNSFPSSGSIKIEAEVIYYTSKTSTTFEGLVRGAGGTTAASHGNNALVQSPILSAHHNALAAAIICAQEKAFAAQVADADLATIAGLSPANDDVIQRKSGSWINRTIAQLKADLELNNVDNTSDANKPVSSAQQAALDTKVPTARTVNGHPLSANVTLDKSDVGLGNVDNTSDASKPVSTATQTALDAKQNLDADLAAIAGLTPANDDVIQRKSGSWINRTIAQVKTDLALTKSDVGLGNVDNTSDASKPVSTATQTALDAKVTANAGITGATKTKITYDAKGLVAAGADATTADVADSVDKRYVTDAQRTVVQNTSGTNAGDQFTSVAVNKLLGRGSAGGTGPAEEITLGTNLSMSGTTLNATGGEGGGDVTGPASSTDEAVARYDGTSGKLLQDSPVTINDSGSVNIPTGQSYKINGSALAKGDVGLGNADNTSDASKPVSTATQTALDAKQASDADLTAIAGLAPANDDVVQRKAGAWINRTIAQLKTDLALTKSDVGLGNVDNTSDANKPVSTATQTALDAKQASDADLTAIAGLSPANDDIVQRKAGAWTNRTIAQLKTDMAITWADVNKSTSSLADIATRSASDLSSGTLAVARGGTNKTSWTAGSVAFAASSSALGEDNAKFFYDEPNDRLGLGVNSFDSAVSGIQVQPTARSKAGFLITDTDGSRAYYMGIDSAGSGLFVIYDGSGVAKFTFDNGIVVGAATGGDKGAGTINAVAVYDDNVLLTDWIFSGAKPDKLAPYKRLFGLEETFRITQTEHRLPWMPKATEFERERHVGGMVTRIWQGQEQQQLYIFELEERVKKLEAALNAILKKDSGK